jgi:hypothetical protein
MIGTVSLTGVLATLGQMFKHGKREDLLQYGVYISFFFILYVFLANKDFFFYASRHIVIGQSVRPSLPTSVCTRVT